MCGSFPFGRVFAAQGGAVGFFEATVSGGGVPAFGKDGIDFFLRKFSAIAGRHFFQNQSADLEAHERFYEKSEDFEKAADFAFAPLF